MGWKLNGEKCRNRGNLEEWSGRKNESKWMHGWMEVIRKREKLELRNIGLQMRNSNISSLHV